MSDRVDGNVDTDTRTRRGDRRARVLVVCNADEADELGSALGDTLSTGPVEIAVGDGGDDTLATFSDGQPEVVVVTASLERGDARALIATMRETAPARRFAVVLIGDVRGPIRNALDAGDFQVDRFVARPIAAKALRYAVAASLTAVRAAAAVVADPAPTPAAGRVSTTIRMPTRAPTRPSMVSGAIPVMHPAVDDDDDDDEAPTAEVGVHDATTRPVSALRARWSALADAIGLSGDDDDLEPATIAPVVILPRRMTTRPGASVESGPVPAPVPRTETAPLSAPDAAPDPATDTATASAAASASDTATASATDPGSAAYPTADVSGPAIIRAPVPALDADTSPPRSRLLRVTGAPGLMSRREPLPSLASVFDEETEPFARALPITAFDAIASDAALDGDDDDDDNGRATSAPLPASVTASGLIDVDDDVDDDAPPRAGGDDGRVRDPWAGPLPVREPTLILANPFASPLLDAGAVDIAGPDDPTVERDPSRPFAGADGAPAPTGGTFARELRKKMSEMAQRLFKSSEVAAPPAVEVGPAHDHHTEIDLTSIGEEPSVSGAPIEPFELVASATYAGDETSEGHPAPGAPAAPAVVGWEVSTRLTAEAGEIVRGHSDAAVLIARLSSQAFTGRLVMRRRSAEKTIHFDAGRPVFASSTADTDRMGQLLAREGKISADQYHRCALLSVETGRRMGEILVERGFMKRRELLPAVRRHVEDIIYSLFAWDSGDYKIVHGDGAADERIRLSKHPAAMVLEGVRRKFELTTLERLLGTPTTIVELADRDRMGGILSASDLSADERVALAAMDGQNDLAQVARKSRIELANVYALAWGLLVLGLATARRRGEEEADTASQVVMGETDIAIDRERVHARHALVADADYFALLGVRRDATTFEIKRAYEAACRDFAADIFTPDLRSELAGPLDDIAEVIDEAYRILRDDALRSEYLANLMD